MSAMLDEAADYVCKRSIRARAARRQSRWIVQCALRHLNAGASTDDVGRLVRKDVKAANPMFAMILIQILLPIIIRLIIEWWLNRNKTERGWP